MNSDENPSVENPSVDSPDYAGIEEADYAEIEDNSINKDVKPIFKFDNIKDTNNMYYKIIDDPNQEW